MPPSVPSSLLLLVLVLLQASSASQELQVRGHRSPREARPDSIKVVISEACVTQGDSSDVSQAGREFDLAPGSPLVLTHKIKLVPSGLGSGAGSCGCEPDLAALRERLERLEREVSTLREECGGADGGCCTSKESKGAGCTIKPQKDECPNECSDQGRCVDAKCVCFPGFSGPDCSDSNCPGNCHDSGRCVNGQCLCDPGLTGPDCSERTCPDTCSERGRCVDGQCVCDGGFTGPDCSELACPGNCNSRGRCVSGQCVCSDGFSGADCSEKTCPDNCNGRGKCVNGLCVCDSGFAGDDCSENSCPGNCNSRGRCVDGQCVCTDGFTGVDCTEKACPSNCSDRGRCVNGKCVCGVGFAGPDCSAKGCPKNCSNRGRCVKGRCVCRREFKGQDCSLCADNMTGPNCDTIMSAVSQLTTRDVTGSSVTLLWTPPPVQYDAYHLTFTSQKDGEQPVTVQVEGSLRSFTQTGLASAQLYGVTVVGEIGGRRGAESHAQFMTLVSGPTNLHVVKTTSTSAVVQWEKPQGEIDRYRLTVTPSDGAGRSQEITVPADRDSAHVGQLEAGRLYDVVLVAERGASRSEPATTQAVPGESLPMVTTAVLTRQVTLAPGQEVGDLDRGFDPSPEVQVSDQQGGRGDGREADSVRVGGIDGPDKHSSSSVPARSKPLVSRTLALNGTRPNNAERLTLSRKPNVPGPFRFNASRVVPGGRKTGTGPLKKPLMGRKQNAPIVPKKPKPGAPKKGNRTIDLTVKVPNTEASIAERRDDKSPPALTSGTDSETHRQKSSEEPKRQPDVRVAGQGNDTAPVSSEPTGTVQRPEKKCLNKLKVTHSRLPHKDRGGGCEGEGTDRSPPDLNPSSAETELDYSPDPLHKLLTETFDSLNITTFSVHLSKPSNLSVDANAVRKQILRGLKPLTSFSSSSSSSSSTSRSSHPTASSSSSSSVSSLLTSASAPQVSSSSTAAKSSSSLLTFLLSSSPPSLTHSSSPPSLTHSSSSLSLTPSSSSPLSSSLNKSDSFGSDELDVDKSKNAADTASPEETTQSPSGKFGIRVFHHTHPKRGFIRRPRPNLGLFQNKTRLNLRGPQRSPSHLNIIPTKETETRHSSPDESPPSSDLEEVKINTPVRDASRDEDGAAKPASSGQDQKPMQTERGRTPVRHPPPKGGYVRRPFPNMGFLQNKTPPNSRLLTRPARPLNPDIETQKEQISQTESPATPSPLVSKESYPAEGREPKGDRAGMRISTIRMSNGLNQTLREPFSHRPMPRVPYYHRPQVYGGPLQNKTRPNLRPPQYPRRGLIRKPFPIRKLNGDTVGSQTSQREIKGTPDTPQSQSGVEDVPRPTRGIGAQIRQEGELETAEVIPSAQMEGHGTAVTPQINKLEMEENAPVQTTKSGEEETITPVSNNDFDIHRQRVDAPKNPAPAVRGRPNTQQTSFDSRASRPATIPKRQPPSRNITGQHGTQMGHFSGGSQRGEDPKTNHTVKPFFDSKTGQTRGAASKPLMGSDVSSSGVTREQLDYVGVTNRTSDGFTLIWDSPEGKYKNFVVTRKQVGKDARPKQQENPKNQERRRDDSEREDGHEEQDGKHRPTEEPESEAGSTESVVTHIPMKHSSTTVKPSTGGVKTFKEVLPGSARSLHFEDLPPRTEYTVTLLGKGPGLLSRLHKLVISTGPEPPTDIVFSEVTENSLTVSWTKPKSPVSGFKVTYTHSEDGEPVSVSLDSEDSSLGLSQLAPGSTYEVSILSILGLDESDPVDDVVRTLPDPPTHLRAVNVTDTKALLLWRPALAAIDKYALVYSSGPGSELRITVSGNAAEQQLSDLEGSTTYTVTITSQQGGDESSPASTSFTTASGSESDEPRDLRADHVTPRTALLSWKPPAQPAGSYRLTYQTEGHEMKELTVDSSETQFNLTRLQPGATYTVQLQAEAGGRYTSTASTEFTTGTLRFPFPTDCSQELLNGIRTSGQVEIFPQGKQATPTAVYCDMETDGGGWTVFQRRRDGSVDFYRGWAEYARGFGDLSGEFWLGLESLHNLTSMTRMSLRVDLRDGDDSAFAKYSTFEVARRNYKLSVGGYSGTAGDSLSYHNNRVFSTKDRDPAPFITRCAMSYRGGWWYKNCHQANLNGLYGIDVKHQGLIWTSWKGKDVSVAFTEMKMRPASFSPPARG
ncbi:tenascin isoform X1 [Scophthalmus maximus]|uniref:tenascin isoform X1 n=1 Tax=Scophthalmus maximus TaxID=52904 RepID=UPI0015E14F42|nr:tenascin isoform X1 [Scophthalmus maximus]